MLIAIFLTLFLWPRLSIDALQSPWRQRSPDDWNGIQLGFDPRVGITDPFARNAAKPVYEFEYGDFGDQPPAEQARKSPTPERPLSELVTRSDVPSTDPDHKKKNDAALRENLKLRQYTGVLNSWSTDLDGFHRFAIEKGRTRLMPFLGLDPANNLVDRQLIDKLRKQLVCRSMSEKRWPSSSATCRTSESDSQSCPTNYIQESLTCKSK
ncbi:unnamed protein product, partial [Mesorhabditis spiculigera]